MELRVSKSELSPTVWGYSYDTQTEDWGYRSFLRMSEQEIADIFRLQLKGSKSKLGMIEPKTLARHLLKLCDHYRFDPALILSLIHVESSFRLEVVSKAGAVGLLQLQPQTAYFVSKNLKLTQFEHFDLENPFTNISLGVAYLAFLRERYSGSFQHLLMGYNLGPGTTDKIRKRTSQVSQTIKKPLKSKELVPELPAVVSPGIQKYIERVKDRAIEFRRLRNV